MALTMNNPLGGPLYGGTGNSGGSSFFSGLGDFFGSSGFNNALGLGSLALQGYGLDQSLGIADDQLSILKDQENRAATAQNLQTDNSLSLALQTTTPGTAEHEAIKKAIEQGTYGV